MNILIIHNYYQQSGGEDQSMRANVALLEAHGHQIQTYIRHNDEINLMPSLQVAADTVWSNRTRADLQSIIQTQRPNVAIIHNSFPLVSPSAYSVFQQANIPVIQFLHNYRLSCLNGLFFRQGQVCEDCLGKRFAWPGILHACYQESRPASTVVASMLSVHHALNTWQTQVDAYITLTEFARQKMIQAGLSAEKIIVQSNFLADDPGLGSGAGGYALFIGRLTPEKGLPTLLTAWENAPTLPPLKIIGSGPLEERVRQAVKQDPRIEYLGQQTQTQVFEWLKNAAFLIFPSEWYETFGRVIIEAFACGTPVLAANIGAASELITDGKNGWLYPTGDAAALTDKIRDILQKPDSLSTFRAAARQEYEQKYTAEIGYQKTMKIINNLLKQQSNKETK